MPIIESFALQPRENLPASRRSQIAVTESENHSFGSKSSAKDSQAAIRMANHLSFGYYRPRATIRGAAKTTRDGHSSTLSEYPSLT